MTPTREHERGSTNDIRVDGTLQSACEKKRKNNTRVYLTQGSTEAGCHVQLNSVVAKVELVVGLVKEGLCSLDSEPNRPCRRVKQLKVHRG